MIERRPHILVIDDNEEMLQVITMMLTKKHFSVTPKTRVSDIEADTKLLQPDLILLDKSLGWIDGCILCKQIKSNLELSHIPVIMLSAYHKTSGECTEAGADAFIRKPFLLDELISTIESFTTQVKRAIL